MEYIGPSPIKRLKLYAGCCRSLAMMGLLETPPQWHTTHLDKIISIECINIFMLSADIRTQEVVKGRSINLALSCRGREALRAVGLEDEMVASGIPMYARMIHNKDGSRHPIPYGKKDQVCPYVHVQG